MWEVWDKKSDINGFSAEWYLDRHKRLISEETVFIKRVNGKVARVEGKNILAEAYKIDPTLPDDEFIAAYEAKLAEMEAEIPPPEEIPDEEIPDEDTDTTTYAELAQVYAEGVNSIE